IAVSCSACSGIRKLMSAADSSRHSWRRRRRPAWADRYPFARPRRSFFLHGADRGPMPAGPPVLAYGANASPEALARKLPGARVAALAGRLRGWDVVHSAHVSPYGAVPATIVREPAKTIDVHVLLVEEGRARLDATEQNYRRVWLYGLDLEVERLGRLDAAEAYVSRHGALVCEGATVPHMWAYIAMYEMPNDDAEALERRVRVRYPVLVDRALGLGELPGVRLQRALSRPGVTTPLDAVLVWAHWLWFFVPLGSIAYLL